MAPNGSGSKKTHHYWLSQSGTILAVVTKEVRNEEAKIPYDDLASDRVYVFSGDWGDRYKLLVRTENCHLAIGPLNPIFDTYPVLKKPLHWANRQHTDSAAL